MPDRNTPAWLRARVDQLLARLNEATGGPAGTAALRGKANVLMLMLTEPPENATEAQLEAWERTCDSCGTVCLDSPFWGGQHTESWHGIQVIIGFGICADCKERDEHG